MLCSSISLHLQLARSADTPRLWGTKFLPWQPWAPCSALLTHLTPGLHCSSLLTVSSVFVNESFGDRVLQPPPRAHGTSRHDSSMGGRRGGGKGGLQLPSPSLLGMHMPVTDGCLPPTPRLRQALASLWQDSSQDRGPPVQVTKASSSAGHGTAHTSVVWSHSERQRCSYRVLRPTEGKDRFLSCPLEGSCLEHCCSEMDPVPWPSGFSASPPAAAEPRLTESTLLAAVISINAALLALAITCQWLAAHFQLEISCQHLQLTSRSGEQTWRAPSFSLA